MKIPLIVATLAVAITVACSPQNTGSNANATAAPPTATATASATAAPVPAATTPAPGTTPTEQIPFTPGQAIPPIVREVVVNVATSNLEGLVALAKPQQIGCTLAQGAGGPPKCKPTGDSPGTLYTVFPTGRCEAEWAPDTRTAIATLIGQPTIFYAAVVLRVPTPDPDPSWPKGGYAVVFSSVGGSSPGIYFILDDTNILRAHAMCGSGTGGEMALLRQIGTAAYLIPPAR